MGLAILPIAILKDIFSYRKIFICFGTDETGDALPHRGDIIDITEV
jgi:hypothetical protein